MRAASLLLIAAVLPLLGGCLAPPPSAALATGVPARGAPAPQPEPTPLPTITAPTALLPTATARPTLPAPDFSALERELRAYAESLPYMVGIAVVDTAGRGSAAVRGDQRFFALSTFKGPLAAYYLWLLERGELVPQPGDEERIARMLAISSNPDTTCIIRRVGGLTGFNDWLAAQDMARSDNFVYGWDAWACTEGGETYRVPADVRYEAGDAALGLPGGGALLGCPDSSIPCNKAFTPLALAELYASLYRSDVIGPQSLARWLAWMEKGREDSALFAGLPPDLAARVYAKDGFAAEGGYFVTNFYHEAGIIEAGAWTFAVAVFSQGSESFPNQEPVRRVAQMTASFYLSQSPAP
jgi:hypothetical protein